MKLLLIIFLFISTSHAGIGIISDLDDTIKITHVSSPASAALNGIFKKKVFTGMPGFLEEARLYSEELHILTASPGFIKRSVHRTLRSNGILFDSVAFKNPLHFEGKIHYKVRKITELLEKSSHDFILIGDDVDKDPEVFDEIMKLFPERIVAAYVHVVRGREIPEGSIRYWTAADLALYEAAAGRMTLESASKVMEQLLAEGDLDRIIPDFADCPVEQNVWDWQLETDLADKASMLINSLVRHCSPAPKA